MRNLVVGGGVAADHLDIDGSGQAEVQNLVGDVGRLEEEHHLRKFLVQAAAEPAGILGHGTVFPGLERDEDIAVADA